MLRRRGKQAAEDEMMSIAAELGSRPSSAGRRPCKRLLDHIMAQKKSVGMTRRIESPGHWRERHPYPGTGLKN